MGTIDVGPVHRLFRRSGIAFKDICRDVHWQFRGKNYFGKHYLEIVNSFRWMFIVGCNNSGTSLLHEIFRNCGQVSTLRHEGQRYSRALPRAYKKGHDRVWSEFIDDLKVAPCKSAELAPRLAHDWIHHLAKPIRPVIVEKTPANMVRMPFLQKSFPSAGFIGIIRNGYAVAEGIRRKAGKPLDRAARHWAKTNTIMIKEADQLNRFLEIRYEDMVGDFNAAAERLAEFVGIDVAPLIRAGRGRFSYETILGNQKLPVCNLNLQSISRLSNSDIDIIRKNAAPLIDQLGYKPDC